MGGERGGADSCVKAKSMVFPTSLLLIKFFLRGIVYVYNGVPKATVSTNNNVIY
jgi:hypothetical protein